MPPRKSGRKRPTSSKPHGPDITALIEASDLRAYLIGQASQVAPADVESLIRRSDEVRDKASKDIYRDELFRRQLELALALLSDHVNEQCSQIPYHTVALLAAALYYWLEPIDLIPDLIPDKGTADDALVLALAYELGRAGVERYCTSLSIPSEPLFTAPEVPAPPGGQPNRS